MLQDKAMLIKVSISTIDPFKYDRNVSDTTAQVYGGKNRSFRSSKRIIPESAIKDIQKIDTEIRAFVKHNTRPWLDDGVRILASTLFFDMQDGLADKFEQRDKLVAEFKSNWPNIQASAMSELGTAYRAEDFPQDISHAFGYDVIYLPIPRTGDFRADGLDAEEIAKIEEATMARITAQFDSTDLWQRLKATMTTATGTLGERLRLYAVSDEGKVVNKFHDTLITNMSELLKVMPKLNISEDAELTAVCSRINAEVCFYDPQDLRDNESMRTIVAGSADSIMAEISAHLGE